MENLILSGIFASTDKIRVVDALLLALIGIVIVFIVLIALMLIVTGVGKAFDGSEKLKAEHPEWGDKINAFKSKLMFWKKKDGNASTDAQQSKSGETAEAANGTCGEIKLINTDERDAAMIMAIVADSTGTPLNELRFKSIKKVEDNQQ